MSAFSFLMTAGGVALGTSTANQRLTSTPGNPASAKVGMSGRLSTRLAEVTASARTLPLWMWGTAVDVPTMNIPTSPAINAVMACAEDPRYGTWVISTFATDLNNSAAR